ncbi:MAG: aspartate-semialdehyde dehydrogenase [Terriglobia bacterium]
MTEYSVAVVGATGVVGREMIKILEERDFPVSRLRLLASPRSEGEKRRFAGEEIVVERVSEGALRGTDILLFSAGSGVSKEFGPVAAGHGGTVIDNSSAFRMDKGVPLVVPEINGDLAKNGTGIIANPNCSTIQLVLVLAALDRESTIERVVVSTYQSVSGTGREAMVELETQSRRVLDGRAVDAEVYPHQIAFNVLPHCDRFLETGYTLEEAKLMRETKKIMDRPQLRITATAARVPVFVGHSEAVNVQTSAPIAPERARAVLENAPGVRVVDDPGTSAYPMAVFAAGGDLSLVGRIRKDESVDNGLDMWIVADNLRKGAALNAVQIAETLIA